MKRIIAILSIFYCSVICASTPYETMLKELWDHISYESEIEGERGFLCHDLETFFEESTHLERGEKILLFFYPVECGFDHFVINNESFFELETFFKLAQSYGFEITYCSAQRHLVSFDSREEMEEFVQEILHTNLAEKVCLYFPSKIIIAIANPSCERPKSQRLSE